jgi:hypothetical protein
MLFGYAAFKAPASCHRRDNAHPVGDGDRGCSARELSAPEQCDGEGDWRIQTPFLIILLSIVSTPTHTPSRQTSFMVHRITSFGSSPAFARRSATSASSKSCPARGRRVASSAAPDLRRCGAPEQFRKVGIGYDPSERNRSEVYGELLPLINSRRVDLLDDKRTIAQLVQLERRTSRIGSDTISYPRGAAVGAGLSSFRLYPSDLKVRYVGLAPCRLLARTARFQRDWRDSRRA